MDENNFGNNGPDENRNNYGQPDTGSQNQNQNYRQPEPFAQPPESYSQPSSYYGYGAPPQEPEMSVKDWVITRLILIIPCVNIIMLLVWAFSNNNKTRSNFCKAELILMVVGFVLGIVIVSVFGSIAAIFFQELAYYL